MTTFEKQAEKFIEKFSDVLKTKYDAWTKFSSLFPNRSVDSSLGKRLASSNVAADLYWLLAGYLKIRLTPHFSDQKAEDDYWHRYSRFNVWLLGATKGLDLQCVRTFLEECYRDDDNCEVCCENNYGLNGHLSSMQISTQTAIYFVFQSICMNPKLEESVRKLEDAVDEVCKQKKYYEQCEDGECIAEGDDDSDGACGCDEDLECAQKDARDKAYEFFDLVWQEDLLEKETFFNVGLAPYVVHKATPIDSKRGFHVMRTADEEAKEKQRIEEQKQKEKEAAREREKKYLEAQIANQQRLVELSKKRLSEIGKPKNNTKKKKTVK